MKIHIIILYILVLALLGCLVYNSRATETLVYVDNAQLFASFKMKAELEKKYQVVEKQKQAILDSLLYKIKWHEKDAPSENDLARLKQEFMYRKDAFAKENSELMTQYNSQIWNQLNEYAKAFGEKHKYKFIFGTNGQGTLMYAGENVNVTKALIDYANEAYSGK